LAYEHRMIQVEGRKYLQKEFHKKE